MALSDPTNVRVGLVRKQALLQRLAQQMAAKGGGGPGKVAGMVRAAGGRGAGTGSQFQSSANMRTPGAARVTLPFDLPANRARPAGFDPDQSGGNAWSPGPSAVTPSGPPAGGGTPVGGGYSTPDQGIVATTPGDGGYVWTPADSGAYTAPSTTPYGTPAPNSAYISDGQGNYILAPQGTAPDQSAPLNQAAPDPYTMMADAQMQRIIRGRAIAV